MLAAPVPAQWAGAKTCRACHPAQFQSHQASPHARSLARPGDHILAAKFPPKTGDWAFGAGAQAVTFVSRLDAGSYLEHGLSFYPSLGRMAPTPGHAAGAQGVRYPTFSPGAEILRCFVCHSTGTPHVTAANEIVPREPGVACESCHGPGAAHASSGGNQPIVNPRRYTAAETNQLCGSCHRKPSSAGTATDYRDPWNVRHQPVYFSRSACFVKSNGALSCLTCHPAHGGPTRSACLDCHPSARHAKATTTAGRTSASCHMPGVKPIPGLLFANHWIGVYRAADPLIPVTR